MTIIRPASRRLALLAAAAIGLTLAIVTQSQAAGSGMPWEEPLQQVLDSVQGPVAKIVAVIIIIVTGLMRMSGSRWSIRSTLHTSCRCRRYGQGRCATTISMAHRC
ncbi:TrbC/VirB2 family protein [Sphingobium sp. TomTYG45]